MLSKIGIHIIVSVKTRSWCSSKGDDISKEVCEWKTLLEHAADKKQGKVNQKVSRPAYVLPGC